MSVDFGVSRCRLSATMVTHSLRRLRRPKLQSGFGTCGLVRPDLICGLI